MSRVTPGPDPSSSSSSSSSDVDEGNGAWSRFWKPGFWRNSDKKEHKEGMYLYTTDDITDAVGPDYYWSIKFQVFISAVVINATGSKDSTLDTFWGIRGFDAKKLSGLDISINFFDRNAANLRELQNDFRISTNSVIRFDKSTPATVNPEVFAYTSPTHPDFSSYYLQQHFLSQGWEPGSSAGWIEGGHPWIRVGTSGLLYKFILVRPPTGPDQFYVRWKAKDDDQITKFVHSDICNWIALPAQNGLTFHAIPARNALFAALELYNPIQNVAPALVFSTQWIDKVDKMLITVGGFSGGRAMDSKDLIILLVPRESSEKGQLQTDLDNIYAAKQKDIDMPKPRVMTWDEVDADTTFLTKWVNLHWAGLGGKTIPEAKVPTDPYGRFHTFVSVNTMETWNRNNPPRPIITAAQVANIPSLKMKPPTAKFDELLGGRVSKERMTNARGTRRRGADSRVDPAPEGKKCWGLTTNEIVTGLGLWTDHAVVPSIKSPAGKEIWKMGYNATEWNHRIAYSFNALRGERDFQASGVQQNFMFATGECNSLMTYWERTVQDYIRKEYSVAEKLRRAPSEGTITTRRRTDHYLQNGTAQAASIAGIDDYPWLCLNLTWEVEFTESLIFSEPTKFETRFYAFSRPFFTVVENHLATWYCQRMASAAVSRLVPAIASSSPASSTAVPTGGVRRLMAVHNNATTPLNLSQQKMWSSIVTAQTSVKVDSTIIQEPFLAAFDLEKGSFVKDEIVGSPPVRLMASKMATANSAAASDATTPKTFALPSGFLSGGKIKLFGLINATLYQFNHDGGVFRPGFQYSIVVLDNDVSLGEKLPLFGTALDAISLVSPRFTYLNMIMDERTLPGLKFDCDIIFDGALSDVSSMLKAIFHQDKPSVHMTAKMGYDFDMSKPFIPGQITLSGSLRDISVKAGSGDFSFELKEVGIDLMITPQVKQVKDKFVRSYSLGYGFFGTALMGVPGSSMPLSMSYRVSFFADTVYMVFSMTEPWIDVAGTSGLVASAASGLQSSTVMQISASLDISNSSIYLSGTRSQGKSPLSIDTEQTLMLICLAGFTLAAELNDFTLDDLAELFFDITGENLLGLGNHHVEFDTLNFSITNSNSKTTISFSGAVTIDGHTAVGASVVLSSDGISFAGAVSNVTVGDITINSCTMVFNLYKISTGRPSSFLISGNVQVMGLTIAAGVTFGKSAAGGASWAVYGTAQGNLAVSRITSNVPKGSDFDFQLKNVVVIAASDESAGALLQANTFSYPVRQGLQICATVDKIPLVDKLLGGSSSGFIFSCAVQSAQAMALDLMFPSARTFNLGSGLTTGPLVLEIQISPPPGTPQLMLKASLNVPVSDQDPLLFTLGLKLGPLAAEGSAQMNGYWINPFNISKKVKIGPVLSIAIAIDYAAAPSSLGFQGGLVVGSTEVQVAVKIGTKPADELLHAFCSRLSVADVVSFGSDIIGVTIPTPPADLLVFEDVDLYISSGAWLADQFFPAGAAFRGSLTLFGQHAKLDCHIGQELKIKGELDKIEIGPLVVSGAKGDNLIVNIELGASEQIILIDAFVALCALERQSIYINAHILPTPKFQFNISVSFTEVLTFGLEGQMLGSVNFSDISQLDFILAAELKLDILNYISDQCNSQFAVLKEAMDKSVAVAKTNLDTAQKSYDDALRTASQKLDQATSDWHKALDPAQATDIQAQTEIYKKNVANAQASYDAALRDAQNKLQQAQHDAPVTIDNAKLTAKKALNQAQQDVDRAKIAAKNAADAMSSKYGDAERDIQRKQDAVNSLKSQLQSWNDQIAAAEADISAPFLSVKLFSWNPFGGGFPNSIPSIPSIPIPSFPNIPKPSIPNIPTIPTIPNIPNPVPHIPVPDPGTEERRLHALAIIAGLRTSQAGVQAAIISATQALNLAIAVTNTADYVTAKALVAGTAATVVATNTILAQVDASTTHALDAAKVATEQSISTAQFVVSFTQSNSDPLHALQAANLALTGYQAVSADTIDTAMGWVRSVMQGAQYAAYKSAQAGLDLAQANTRDIDVAKAALDLADQAASSSMDLVKWLAANGSKILTIRSVRLSGNLRALLADMTNIVSPGAGNAVQNPTTRDGKPALTASVDGMAMGTNFSATFAFRPGETTDFITQITEKFWKDLRGALKV
ncbi:hypothetical protein EJ08DRAFT_719082 [Tothia fuscella]|uniref:Uncharacterized protein n=1 Tax=Tothia fuscella TaxID=1048955 RepID=A0A9P4NNS7_9PEZI|nr:hypothetical protein EJ08DRAFT_719082 [Tothia fuscella]